MARFKDTYGPWAVVTGASDGIGRATAEALAAEGLNVVLVARREDELHALASSLEARHGIDARVIAVDLSAPSATSTVALRTDDLDVGLLVAAAGFGTSGELLDNAIDHELNMIDVNCRSVVELTHHFGTRLVKRGRGGLVLLSSIVAFQGVPRAANYAATKSFVQTLAEGLRIELGRRGVHVLSCAPGPVASGFAARANMQMGVTVSPSTVARGMLRALGRQGTVRPGFLSKILEASLFFLPRSFRVRIMTFVMGGMTKHQGLLPASTG